MWLGNETPHKLGVIWGLCRFRGGRGCLGEGVDSRCQIVSPNPSSGAPSTPRCFLDSCSLPEPSPHPVLACPCPGAPRSHLRALPLSQPTFPGEHSPPVLSLSGIPYASLGSVGISSSTLYFPLTPHLPWELPYLLQDRERVEAGGGSQSQCLYHAHNDGLAQPFCVRPSRLVSSFLI